MTEQPPSAPQRGTGLAFVEHWSWVADKGLMPKNTAMAIRAAVSQILKIDEGWEAADVRQLDADGLIARFRNLSKLSPTSLATYESRFRSGLASYLAYLDNPASYQPKARKQAAQRVSTAQPRFSRNRRRRTGEASTERPGSMGASGQQVGGSGVRLVVYPFPVRPEVFAELKLPADLTTEEAERLSGFLKAVALSQGPSEQ